MSKALEPVIKRTIESENKLRELENSKGRKPIGVSKVSAPTPIYSVSYDTNKMDTSESSISIRYHTEPVFSKNDDNSVINISVQRNSESMVPGSSRSRSENIHSNFMSTTKFLFNEDDSKTKKK